MPWYYDEAGAPTSLKGKVAIVTGSSSGIGMGVATGLFRMGATVVVTSRSVAKAEKACKSIVRFVASDPRATDVAGALEPMALVLDDFESVAQFAKGFVAKHSALDYYVQNAGVAFAPQPPNDLTKDGSFEAVYAGNYLGHFLLTELLLPTIKATPGARVSFTSSITHWGATFDLDDLLPDGDLARGRRKDDNVYQNSKLLQILHCFELQRRLRGTGVTLTPVAPGLIQTDIFDNDDKRKGGDFKTDVSWPMQSIEEGCKTNLHALLSPSMEGQEGYFLQPYYSPKHQNAPYFGGMEQFILFEALQQRRTWGLHRWLPHPNAHRKAFASKLYDSSKAAVAKYL